MSHRYYIDEADISLVYIKGPFLSSNHYSDEVFLDETLVCVCLYLQILSLY